MLGASECAWVPQVNGIQRHVEARDLFVGNIPFFVSADSLLFFRGHYFLTLPCPDHIIYFANSHFSFCKRRTTELLQLFRLRWCIYL